MKKLLPLLLAVCFLCACGSAPAPAEEPKPAEAPVAETAAPTPEPTPEPTPTFEPVVLVDNDNFTFTITGINPAAEYGWGDVDFSLYEISYFCENKTDKNVLFTWDDVSVNGFMIDPMCSCDVVAGKKANSTTGFALDVLAENGIEAVEEIEFTLRVLNEMWESNYDGADPAFKETFVFKP